MIKWNEHLITGISEIDNSYRYLIQLINDTYDGYLSGTYRDSFHLGELYQCMADSFVYEESLMLKSDYGKYAPHKAEHELFTSEFIEMSAKGEDINEFIETLLFLNSWVQQHLQESDANLGKFLASTR